jgi:hypothetical protein
MTQMTDGTIVNVSRAHALAAYPHTRRRIGTTSPGAISRRVIDACDLGQVEAKGAIQRRKQFVITAMPE